MLRLLIAPVLVLAPLSAMAQAGDTSPARQASMATPASEGNTPRHASVAPPADEQGWTVIWGKNWYIRYRTDEEATGDEDEAEGTVSVVPALKPAASGEPEMRPPAAPPTEEQVATAAPDCSYEYQLLAQRLLYLRGIDVDPRSAGLVLPQAEIPYSPLLTRAELGLESRYVGGSLLMSALSWDTQTQQLTAALARCMEP